MAHKGMLGIMFNNARVVGPQQLPSIADLDLDQLDKVIRINIWATLAGIKNKA